MADVSLPGVGVSLTSTGVSLKAGVSLTSSSGGIAASGVNVVAANSFNAASVAIFNAFTTPPTAARQVLINNLVVALINAGVWSLLDVLYLLAAADSQAAKINWKSPGTFTATEVNAPAFVADRGYTSNGSTSYLNAVYNPQTAAGNLTQDSAHLAVHVGTNTAAATTKSEVGWLRGRISALTAASAWQVQANSTSTSALTNTPNTSLGAFLWTRVATGAFRYFQNGSFVASVSLVSSGLSNSNMLICAWNNSGTPANFSDRQVSAVYAGGGLTDAQVSAAYTAVAAYLTAVGAPT